MFSELTGTWKRMDEMNQLKMAVGINEIESNMPQSHDDHLFYGDYIL